jgi:hypothetical protein
MPVLSIYRQTQVAAAVVSPTPQGFVFPAAAAATPINRQGPAPAPVDSPTRLACAYPEMVVHPMPTLREIPVLALLASPIRPGCAFRGVDASEAASGQGSEIEVSFQSTRLERSKLNLIV